MTRHIYAPLVVACAVLQACSSSSSSDDDFTPDPGDASTTQDGSAGADGTSTDASAGKGGSSPDGSAGDAATSLDAAPDVANEATPDGPPETGPEAAAPPAGCVQGDFLPFFGNLHAHSNNSDGELSPAEAFAYARDQGHLDIFALTDHLEQLYTGTSKWSDCKQAADAANAPGSYLAMCGYEYGSGFDPVPISTGHNNVFFNNALFPAVQLDFHDFYQSLIECPGCMAQFNHPGSEDKQTWNDFEYVAGADEKINLIEMSGEGDTWKWLFVALEKGWHVSPEYNQDNHSADWGTKNDGRSGFFLKALNRVELYDAMKNRRSFSTLDKNASLRLMAQGVCWMGSILSGVQSLELSVEAKDADATDAFTVIELFGKGQQLVGTVDCAGKQSCSGDVSLAVTEPGFVLARATQADGNTLVSAPVWFAP